MDNILVCDIGGTNSRFARFSKTMAGEIKFDHELWEKTNDFNSFEELLDQVKNANGLFYPKRFTDFVIAVPGPVTPTDRLSFPNVQWSISRNKLSNLYPEVRIAIINDFTAQAYGCLTEATADALPIISKTSPQKPKDLAIIGAGTGTGHCALKRIGSTDYLPIPSEAGHTPFPFVTGQELKFRDFLIAENGITYPTCNDVVSGPGLARLHQFITGKSLSPSKVMLELTPEAETTRWFAQFYARSCKNYALNVLGSGGELFISGGVAIKNPFLVDNDYFRNEFRQCSPKIKELLNIIPVSLIRNEKIGLWGSAYYGFEIIKQQ